MNEQRQAQKGGGGGSLGFAPPSDTGTSAQGGRRATNPATLRQLAAELRGPPWPGENLRAAAALEAAAAQLDVVAELRESAAIVVRSYHAAGGPPWPAIVVLHEVLKRPQVKL